MIKKVFFILIATTTLYSCGPRRLQCGPGRRCELPQKNTIHSSVVFQKKANT